MKTLSLFLAMCPLLCAQVSRSARAVELKTADVQTKQAAASSIKPTSSQTTAEAAVAPATGAKYEYFTNVTIPAGQTVNLDSMIDFSSSDTVKVTVRSANGDLLSLLGTAFFTVPNATEFVTQEAFLGSDFFYTNTGGATFQVCGPQFRMALRNLGSTTITLTSVVIYTHVL